MTEYEKWVKRFSELSFSEKLSTVKKVNDMCATTADNRANMVAYDGCLSRSTEIAAIREEGESYVYLWKHCWGDPFYVGSGKGDRWYSLGGRCDDFYLHLDSGDAVVYLVLSGVDTKTARAYERYVSANLSYAGYTLANGDNNAEYASPEARDRMMRKCIPLVGQELTQKVEGAVLKILNDNARCDYRITDSFLMRYGSDYFSRKYVFGKSEVLA